MLANSFFEKWMFAVFIPSLLISCGGGTSTTSTSSSDSSPAVLTSIAVTPSSATVQINSTQAFAAVANDQHGNPMSGVTIAWTSSNTTVGNINSSGIFTASTTTGITTITATSGTIARSASLAVASPGSANIAYSSGIISINSGSVTLDDLYHAVDNPAVLSKSGTEYILTANIKINIGASLTIDSATLKFNEPSHNTYGITNTGVLNISGAIITSATGNAWYIDNLNVKSWLGDNPKMFINDSDFSVCGVVPNPCIRLGDFSVYGGTPIPLTWNNISIHDTLGYYALFLGYEPYWVEIQNSRFYNLKWRMIDLTRGTIRNSTFHDLDTQGSSGLIIISWGQGGSVYDSEFYNINIGKPMGGDIFYCKEASGGCVFQNNHVHDFNVNSVLGIYGSQQVNPTIYRNNVIENGAVSNDGVIYWRANQYLGGVNLTSQVYNNTISNITGPLFAWHSGGQNARIWNNTVSNVSGLSFIANYQASQAGGGQYHPGDSAGSMLRDMELINIRIYDLDDPADQSIHGQLLPFVNVKYNSVTVDMPDDKFYDYKYLDVKVTDSNSNPINGATVTIANNTDPAYPSINIDGTGKSSFVTGGDGHTPLPADSANSAAILDFYKTSTTQQEMSYTITASYGDKTASTTVAPDATWYRADPAVPASSGTVVLTIN